MRVHLGSDHAGFDLKTHLVRALVADGHDVVDHGPVAFDPVDDYPPFCLRAALAVSREPGSLGVVVGGSGNGEQIAANKVPGIRAVLAWSEETARLGRQHNDAHVIAVGGRMHSAEEATGFVRAFLAEPFSGDARHQRRLDQVGRWESDGVLPPLPEGHPADPA
ncbi:ribose-5-phosphate isomerase [Aquipuribacter nitratireducens]|uniref:Ribose-5-phosphate isomerase B n=1 Tax=Aquipuribacter nitratireducens TaxID=650104 RepID=A0ABW0GK74_9MICO